MTAGQHIDYEALAQDALRGVVRAALAQVARSGLIGDHHFYVAFNTHAPGVSVSKRLREKYPDEMTIVLQHRFRDLEVNEEHFEVKLTFDGIPERVVVPFRAVKVFYDPSVPYGLQFEESELTSSGARRTPGMRGREETLGATSHGLDQEADGGPATLRPVNSERVDKKRERPVRRPRPEKPDEAPAAAKPMAPALAPLPIDRRPAVGAKVGAMPAKPVLTEVKSDAAPLHAESSGGKVVDLSKFRKK